MEEIKLEVQLRSQVGYRKIRCIRREDAIPAIIYGGKEEPSPVKLDRRTYEKIMRSHKGQNVLFHLDVLDGNRKVKDCTAIVKEEQFDPVSDAVQHLDFHRISLTQEIKVKVSIVTKGEAIGVKQDGGSLEHGLWELDVICLPTKIPEKIEVDVSALKIGDAIHVRDIILPEGVRTGHDADSTVVSVVHSMQEEVEAAQPASIEPEVIKAKKEKEPAEGKASEQKKEEK